MATLTSRVATLEATLTGLAAAIARIEGALVVTSAPVTHATAAGTVVAPKPRTFATRAERLAGNGFACSCGRRDLRVAPKSGSFHKAPDGTTHTIA